MALKVLIIYIAPQQTYLNTLKVMKLTFSSEASDFIITIAYFVATFSDLKLKLNFQSSCLPRTEEERIIYIFIYSPQRRLLGLQSTVVCLRGVE